MKHKLVLLVLLALTHISFAAPRQSDLRLGDVRGSFDALKHHGEWMGFNMRPGDPIAPGPLHSNEDLTGKTHYQGIARWHHARHDVPYMLVTRSGVVSVDRANMLVVRMGSRDPYGERMRSNRLLKDKSTNETPPPANDVVVLNYTFTNYHHVGSVQLAGDILAVPLEDPNNCRDCERGEVVFLNMSNPLQPTPLPYSLVLTNHKAGVVGLTRLLDGHFLLVLAWGQNEQLAFYRSTQTDFLHPQFSFQRHALWYGTNLTGGTWPQGSPASYQMLNLLTQTDGRVFMVAARNSSDTAPIEAPPVKYNRDYLALFEVLGFQAGTATTNLQVLQIREERRVYCDSEGSTDNAVRSSTARVNADFLAGIGTYVSPSGELLVYAAEHWNDGPNRSVRMVEFRHEKVVRDGSSAYSKLARAGDRYTVAEGSSITLDGSQSRPQIVKPWIELFEHDNFEGRSVVIDWPDRNRDDYKDFRKLDDFNDKATSFRFWAPLGWRIRLHNQDNWGLDETFIDLFGSGTVQSNTHLSSLGLNDRVTSVQMLPPNDHPFDSALTFAWTAFSGPASAGRLQSTSGSQVVFNASNGPARVSVRLQVGPSPLVEDVADIDVTNVPPAFSSVTVNPSLTVTGRVDLTVNFTDPGATDMHDLRVQWGDGNTSNLVSSIPARSFTSHHVYSNEDPINVHRRSFTISLRLRDSDGDMVTTTRNVTVTFYDPTSTADADGDGLPDTWEDFYLGDRSRSGSEDTDGDGLSNEQEYIAGTDPNNPADALTLQVRPADGANELFFFARRTQGAGYGKRERYFTIEAASEVQGPWLSLGSAYFVRANENWFSILSPRGTGGMRFYRFRAALNIDPLIPGLSSWWRGEDDGNDSIGTHSRVTTATQFADGYIGRAFAFDGVANGINLANPSDARMEGAWTAAFWVYRENALGVSAALLMDSQYALKAEQAGTERRVGFTRFGFQDYAFNFTIPEQTWTHVVIVSSSTVTTLYANGAVQGVVSAAIPLPLRTLGGAGADRFRGRLDEIGIYPRALTAEEVQELSAAETRR